MSSTTYTALPFPLCNLPEPDEPVTLVHLCDVVLPLLRSVRCDLHALAVNAAHDHLILDDLASSLAMKAEYVDLCRNLIDRAPHDELRDATLPTLGSARCLLHSLGLTVPRDIIQEGLASALAGLAEQIEACRDRVDRATRDR